MGMKPEFKKVWVDALRSGEFKQGRHTLKNADGQFCCLGVACVVWQRTLLPAISITPRDATSFNRMNVTFEGACSWLSTPVALDDAVGLKHTGKLAAMNDDGVPFAEIANYIEANL